MKMEIPLSNGMVSSIDKEDYELVCPYKWSAIQDRTGRWVAIRCQYRNSCGRTVYMHREILGAKEKQLVDHWDGDGLNNTRSNLRIATRAENMANSRKKKNSSGPYKGVTPLPNGKWRAMIKVEGTQYHLGCFVSAEDARDIYNAKAEKIHGEFAFHRRSNLAKT